MSSELATIPEDRRERGLILTYSVADNLVFGTRNKATIFPHGRP